MAFLLKMTSYIKKYMIQFKETNLTIKLGLLCIRIKK